MARRIEPRFFGQRCAPEFAKKLPSRGVRDRRISGQQVRQKPHIRGAARICIIAQSHEPRALALRGPLSREIAEPGERRALNGGAEEHDEIVFARQERREARRDAGPNRFRRHSHRPLAAASLAIAAASCPPGISTKSCALRCSFCSRESRMYRRERMMPDGGANLPGDQRILLGGIVADQQKRRRRGQVAHGGEICYRQLPEVSPANSAASAIRPA